MSNDRGDRAEATPSVFSGRPLATGERVVIAITIALGAGLAAFLAFRVVPGMFTRDVAYPWRAARRRSTWRSCIRLRPPSLGSRSHSCLHR